MDGSGRKDLIRTLIIAAFFIILGILILDQVIGNAGMPPRL